MSFRPAYILAEILINGYGNLKEIINVEHYNLFITNGKVEFNRVYLVFVLNTETTLNCMIKEFYNYRTIQVTITIQLVL